jgi:hypothetical protein
MGDKSSGIGFMSILFFIFLVLKLCGVITWSWWWVTAPLWLIPVSVIGLGVVALMGILITICTKK